MPTLERERLLERLSLAAAAALACVAALARLTGTPLDLAARLAGPIALAAAAVVLARKSALRLAWMVFVALVPFAFPKHALFADATAGALLATGWLALARRLETSSDAPTPVVRVAVAVLGALTWTGSLALVGPFDGPVRHVPPLVVAAFLGACQGVLMGLPLLPAFVRARTDAVLAALRMLAAVRSEALRGLVHELVDARARVLRAVEGLATDDALRTVAARSADAVALAGITLVERFSVADAVLATTPVEALQAGLERYDASLATTTDASVTRDLTRARDVTREQLDQVRALAVARERLVARLQAEVAALRRNETSIALLSSADAAVAALQLEAIGHGLSRRAADLAAEGLELHAAMATPPVFARA